METILDEIIEVKREEVKLLRREYNTSKFRDSEFFDKHRFSITESIGKDKNISIIAEIKKASPSKGIIREDFNHLKIADIYMTNLVNGISVLTDRNFFKGDINFLREIAGIKTVPLLRKDFIIDEYQIFEAKSNGADFILLIAEVLSENQIKELTHAAFETDLEVLLELHSEEELSRIDFDINKLIGINNRDLRNFSVDLNTSIIISENIGNDIIVISESGISEKKDIERLKESKINGVLVGEHLMKAEDIQNELKQLKEWCNREG